jgi:hypothetical protein
MNAQPVTTPSTHHVSYIPALNPLPRPFVRHSLHFPADFATLPNPRLALLSALLLDAADRCEACRAQLDQFLYSSL